MKDFFLYLSSMLILLSANDHPHIKMPGNTATEAGIIAPAASPTAHTLPLRYIPISYKQHINRVIDNLTIETSRGYPASAKHSMFLYAWCGDIRGNNKVAV